jgi:ATP-dependent Zn protease
LVSIEPDEFTEGRIYRSQNPGSEPITTPTAVDLQQLVDEIVVLLAGPLAELRFTGCVDSVGPSNDWERAKSLATRYARVLHLEEFMDWLHAEAEEFVNAFWAEIEKLATNLHDRKRLDERDVRQLLKGSMESL